MFRQRCPPHMPGDAAWICYGCSLSPLVHYFTHSTFHRSWTTRARICLARGPPTPRSQVAHPLRRVLPHYPIFVASPSAPVPFAAVKTFCNRRSLRLAAPLSLARARFFFFYFTNPLYTSALAVARASAPDHFLAISVPSPPISPRHVVSSALGSAPRSSPRSISCPPPPPMPPFSYLHSLLPTSFLGPDVATGLLCIYFC
ncbi:hypothetical protein EDB84DRAFT_545782 [Lactarius hengduanensis]|nr:hypothetical protein EDB84DRAFT_545782 [Lactarius hengduanensis]